MNNNKEIKIYGVRPLLEAINSGKSINKVIFKRNNSLNPNQKKL
jgi:tRNA G18 (ribose-2'-O)-methylase SpoU